MITKKTKIKHTKHQSLSKKHKTHKTHKTHKNHKTYKLQNKNTKGIKLKKHFFYIVGCEYNDIYDLDSSILHKYLTELGLFPDNKGMKYVEKQYEQIRKQYKLSKAEFCESFNKNLIRIPNNFIKADIFFYNIYSPFLNKPFYKYNAFLSNTINIDQNQINKNIIYANIIKYNSKKGKVNLNYLIETFLLSEEKKFIFPENYILRPMYAFAGKDILYIQSSADLSKAIEYYKTHQDYKRQSYSLNEIIASKFITDLLLFKGRKFHLRIYYIVAILEGELSCFVLEIGKIATAKLPYDLTKTTFTKDMHDTHLSSTDDDYVFPEDFTSKNVGLDYNDEDMEKLQKNIIKKIRKISTYISNIFVGLVKLKGGNAKKLLFENQQNGYYIYGLDILIKADLDPALVECNIEPSVKCHTPENMKILSKLMYGWINKIILEPLFKYPGRATQQARKHKTYLPLD